MKNAWSSPGRRYHGLAHLADCLRELDTCAARADIAELALWYHDAVYDPKARDNEAQSAALFREHAVKLGLPSPTVTAVTACIDATMHTQQPTTPEAQLVTDIDLSILGRDPLTFMDYEYAIAEEYTHVPTTRFIVARGRFLAQLVNEPAIFHTDEFRARYEATARRNITTLLKSARYRAHRWLGRLYGFAICTAGS